MRTLTKTKSINWGEWFGTYRKINWILQTEKHSNKCWYYITINNEVVYLDTLTNKEDTIKIWAVWKDAEFSQGKDYPTFYKNKSDAQNHFNNCKEDDTEYVSIGECKVRGWGSDKMEILEEKIIEFYHAD